VAHYLKSGAFSKLRVLALSNILSQQGVKIRCCTVLRDLGQVLKILGKKRKCDPTVNPRDLEMKKSSFMSFFFPCISSDTLKKKIRLPMEVLALSILGGQSARALGG
jgi:hypothetical protein